MQANNLIVNGDAVFNGRVYGIKFSDAAWKSKLTTTASQYYKIGSVDIGDIYESFCGIYSISVIPSLASAEYTLGNIQVGLSIGKGKGAMANTLMYTTKLLNKFSFIVETVGTKYNLWMKLDIANCLCGFNVIAETSIEVNGNNDHSLTMDINDGDMWTSTAPSGTVGEKTGFVPYSELATTATKLQTTRKFNFTGAVTGSVSFDGSKDVEINLTTNHTHNYAGSSSAGGAATSAEKLSTARGILVKLDSTSKANFDGSADTTPGVSGVLPIANGGTGNTSGTAQYLSAHYIGDTGDLNTITNTGFYYCPANATAAKYTNCPTTDAFFMLIGKHAGTSQTLITYRADSTFKLYQRNYYNGTWSNWARIYTTVDKPTASDVGAAAAGHTHNYAGSASAGGAATSALIANSLSVHASVTDLNAIGKENGLCPYGGTSISNGPVSGADYGTVLQISNINAPTAGTNGHWVRQIAFSTNGNIYSRQRINTGNWSGWNTLTYRANMGGATTSAAGSAGLVPAPAAGAANRYLRSDGTWQVPPDTTYADMKAATASAAGTRGLVPAPAAGNQGKFLRGDGTWQTPTNTTYGAVSSTANGLATPTLLANANGALQKTGGTMTGQLIAQANTAYTTAQVRNITMSTAEPSGGTNGQIHFKYT